MLNEPSGSSAAVREPGARPRLSSEQAPLHQWLPQSDVPGVKRSRIVETAM